MGQKSIVVVLRFHRRSFSDLRVATVFESLRFRSPVWIVQVFDSVQKKAGVGVGFGCVCARAAQAAPFWSRERACALDRISRSKAGNASWTEACLR